MEYKAVVAIARVHEQQALSYLKASGLPLAIVINFGSSRVEYSRDVNTPWKPVSRGQNVLKPEVQKKE
jgi:hypothetical protein